MSEGECLPSMAASVYEFLLAWQDVDYRAFQSALMPTVDPATVIGVRTPILRRLAKEMAVDGRGMALLSEKPHRYFEENQLHAYLIDVLYRRDFEAAVAAVDDFLPYVDNWATCDQLSPRVFKGRFDQLLPHIRRWMQSDHPYTIRFGMGMLMRYGLDEAFDLRYLEAVADPAITGREEYYVHMMVAWFFATALAKQYEAALPYIADCRLPPWIHRKAIQKACESYRVTPEHKAVLREWRETRSIKLNQ